MKKSVIIALCMVMLFTAAMLAGCDPEKTTATPPDTALDTAWCQQITDDIKSVQPGTIPDNLTTGDSAKTGEEWEANAYFTRFKHITMDDGYVLDYVYYFSGSGGLPVLYVRPADAVPYKTHEEFTKAANAFTRPENDISAVWLVMGETNGMDGNKIKLDGTRESYFEYIVLQLLGSQFYLFWHANYSDTEIVCTTEALEDVLKANGETSYGEPVDEEFKANARKISLEPKVKIDGDKVTVEVVVFSKWGGFSRLSFLMYRDYPHMVIGVEETPLVEYDCGVRF